jgi:twinkle protein
MFAATASTAVSPTPNFLMKESPMLQKLNLNPEHATWLEEARKIPSELAAEIGFVSRGRNIAFEYRKNGTTMFRKVRCETKDPETGKRGKTFFIEPAGAKLFLFNEDCLNEPCAPTVPLIICEGEIDAASWMQAGATRVVSVPNGARAEVGTDDIVPEEDTAFSYLWEGGHLRPEIDRFQKIIIASDGDRAGLALREELSIRLGRSKCYVVTYPDGCKDANDVLQTFGERGQDMLMDMIDRAIPLVADKLIPLIDIPERGPRIIYSAGWEGLDPHFRVVMPELIVVTGPPGSGKSQFTLSVCMNLARLHHLKGAIFQFEDDPDRNKRDILKYAKSWAVGAADGKGVYVGEDYHGWARRMFYAISPDEDDNAEVTFNLDWLFSTIREAVVRHGCKWVLIDPWNEIEHVWKISENETGYTNKALRDIKRLARQLGIAIFIVAHPSKAADGKTIDELNLYHVSGSSAWKNKADHGIVVLRDPEDPGQTFIKIDKSKDWQKMGVPGKVTMEFVPERASFKFVKGGT